MRPGKTAAAHFFTTLFAFTVWTLTGQLPKGILSVDSRTVPERNQLAWNAVLGPLRASNY
jgi:hypothetical protein